MSSIRSQPRIEASRACNASHHAKRTEQPSASWDKARELVVMASSGGGFVEAHEYFSATGVRVPDAGYRLGPREKYENPVAAFYAEQGRVHFAELLEAGHGCAACHLTHGINGVPTDAEIDLERYASVAKTAKIARDAVDVVASGSIAAGARAAKLLEGPSKMTLFRVSDPLDPLMAREMARLVAENPVAYRSYQQLLAQGTEVILDFSPNPGVRDAGRAYPYLNKVVVFMANNRGAREAASTLCHEAQHMRRAFRRLPIETQLDEYRSALREHLFDRGRRPSVVERREIWDFVREDYAHLPLGR